MTRSGRMAGLLLGIGLAFAASAVAQSSGNIRPTAAFRAYGASSASETTVLFDATYSVDSDGLIISYQWAFGDGTTGSGATKEHTYDRLGTYEVTLMVTDNGGASAIVTRTIDLSNLESGRDDSSTESGRPAVVPSSAPVGNQVGNRAPQFTLPTLDGDLETLSDHLGEVVVVDFWFSTCSGCLATLPELAEIQTRFGDRGLVVIIIVLDRDPTAAREYFASGDYDGLIVVHESNSDRPTRSAYGVTHTPHAFLIDRSGAIRYSGNPRGVTAEAISDWL